MDRYTEFMDRKTQYLRRLPSQLVYKLNAMPFKIPAGFLGRNRQTDCKSYMEMQRA